MAGSWLGAGRGAGAEPMSSAGLTPGAARRLAQADVLRPTIRPRSDWAGGLAPTGNLEAEDDVRFLLVHHTASTNNYGQDDVVGLIRGFYEFHTGPEKGWPDVAYNFLVDRYGGIWEARAGSVAGPVRGDATGGSQGFALLCSLIGDHSQEAPTPEARASMVALLAWLGAAYGVDTTPGATVSFMSRGSSRWRDGLPVTARTISGHREMSLTSCPGDLVFDLLDEEIPNEVNVVRASAGLAPDGSAPTTSTETTSTTESAEPTDTSSTEAPVSTSGEGGDASSAAQDSPGAPSTSTSAADASATDADAASQSFGNDTGPSPGSSNDDELSQPLLAAGAVATVLAVAAAAIDRLRGRTRAG